MRAFTFHLSAVAVTAFGAIIAAQAMPEITAPTLPSMSDNQTWVYTTPLIPGDEDYVDESAAARLAKRSTNGPVIYSCADKNWAGGCLWTPLVAYKCQAYPGDAASSFGPPKDWQCKIFYSKGCQAGTGTDGKLTYPGTKDIIATYNRADKPASYMCRLCKDAGGSSPCINNNAPDFYFAQAKYGYGGEKSKCTLWTAGSTTTTGCLSIPTVNSHFT